MTLTNQDPSTIVPTAQKQPEPLLTNDAINDWAFVTLISQHMKESIKNGTFRQLQTLLQAQGFTVALYNPKKVRKQRRR